MRNLRESLAIGGAAALATYVASADVVTFLEPSLLTYGAEALLVGLFVAFVAYSIY